jgi:hypothetical protein
VLLALVFTGVACGKKGPPLTPFVLVPSAPALAVPRRIGSDLYVDVTVPATNLDKSMPAAVSRIDVYAVTSLTPPARARFLEIAELVATIPVAPSGEPGETIPVVPDPAVGALQGATVTIRDALTADKLEPRSLPSLVVERATPAPPPGPAAALPAATPARFLRRFYLAIASTGRNRIGPPSPIVELPLSVLPPPPADLEVTVTDVAASVQWSPSGGLIGWLFDRPLPDELAPGAVDVRPSTTAAAQAPPPADWLPGPTTYRVYRSISPDPLALPAAGARGRPWELTAPAALNPLPLAQLQLVEPIVFDDRERCYYVRAVRGTVESDPSPQRCIRAIDVTPPVTPTGLAAITGEGAINLIWEPNIEEDLGGYVVLRREAGDATLVQLTPRPILETRYSDPTVKPGVRYTYEVRAVDRRVPVPNVSDPVELSETAR